MKGFLLSFFVGGGGEKKQKVTNSYSLKPLRPRLFRHFGTSGA